MYQEIKLLLLHFTLTVVASLKIWKRLISKKMLALPAPFQHFRFRFRPLSSKCFRFHKKLTASTTSSLRFHIPGSKHVKDARFVSNLRCAQKAKLKNDTAP